MESRRSSLTRRSSSMSNFSTSSDSNPLIPPLPAHGRHPTHNRSCPDMTSPIRFATASLLAASLAFGLAACKPIDNDAKKEDKADAAAGGNDIAKSTGLKTEKEQDRKSPRLNSRHKC